MDTTKAKPMSKKRRRITRPAVSKAPRPRAYVPPECSLCVETRRTAKVKPGNYSQVTATKQTKLGTLRYCRCKYCGNTWKHLENSAQ